MARTIRTADVPCDGCTACCRKELVVLFPEHGDDLDALRKHHVINGVTALDRRQNGDCVYLEERGCSVWEKRPAMCRAFDCRLQFLSFTRSERRRMKGSKEIFAAGTQAAPYPGGEGWIGRRSSGATIRDIVV